MKDLTGKRFGRLIVLRDSGKRYKGNVFLLCKCDCGKLIETREDSLKSGRVRSCGCLRIDNLKGKTFGKLTVLRESKERRKNAILWECLCLCGRFTKAMGSNLRSGKTKSCGYHCAFKYKHGDSRPQTRLYRAWADMKKRCVNPNNKAYKYYGKRGIKVCAQWKDNYRAFKFWAILNGYQDNLTIDRIDNDGDYSPQNCQWITCSENSKKSNLNRDRNKKGRFCLSQDL